MILFHTLVNLLGCEAETKKSNNWRILGNFGQLSNFLSPNIWKLLQSACKTFMMEFIYRRWQGFSWKHLSEMWFITDIFQKSTDQFRTVTFNRLVLRGNIDGIFCESYENKNIFLDLYLDVRYSKWKNEIKKAWMNHVECHLN